MILLVAVIKLFLFLLGLWSFIALAAALITRLEIYFENKHQLGYMNNIYMNRSPASEQPLTEMHDWMKEGF